MLRAKSRRLWTEKRAFIFSFSLTFLLAVGLMVGTVLVQIDKMRADHPNLTINKLPFVFYECKGLNLPQFVLARLMETIVPTAVTFSATVLCLQTNPAKKQGWFVWLLVSIVLLVVLGIVLPTAKTLAFLNGYLIALGVVYFLSLVFAWNAFSTGDDAQGYHKLEPSDGSIIAKDVKR